MAVAVRVWHTQRVVVDMCRIGRQIHMYMGRIAAVHVCRVAARVVDMGRVMARAAVPTVMPTWAATHRIAAGHRHIGQAGGRGEAFFLARKEDEGANKCKENKYLFH